MAVAWLDGLKQVLGGAVLGLALIGTVSCSSGEDAEQTAEQPDAEAEAEEKAEEKEEEKKPKKETAVSVNVAEVTRGDLVVPVFAEGSIRARRATDVKFEVGGRVEILVREGQWVRKGQPLARVDDREYALALEEARSRYLRGLGQLAVEDERLGSSVAERNLNELHDELGQMERDGSITREERLDRELAVGIEAVRDGAYRRELIEVRSGLHTARADMARLELSIEKTRVLAPFGGVISSLTLTSNEHVQVGDRLARLVDQVNVEAVVGVLESDLKGIEKGRPVLVELPALGETVRAEIDVISPEIDSASRTCDVLIRLRSEKGRIKPGMFVRASIAGAILPDRTLVPREAVLTRDGRPVLFKVAEGRSKWVYVQLGQRNEHVVEITRIDQGGPLDPGTQVVVSNHLTLTHDAKIKVKKTVPLADPWTEASETS